MWEGWLRQMDEILYSGIESGGYCTRCNALIRDDPYNHNYKICDCEDIGQVDICSENIPIGWERVNIITTVIRDEVEMSEDLFKIQFCGHLVDAQRWPTRRK